MGSLVYSPGSTNDPMNEPNASTAAQTESVGLNSYFRSLPPERVGLRGEYDHSGLAKRVDRALQQKFAPQDLEALKIFQRGRVVILTGHTYDKQLLRQIVDIAASIDGATAIEAYSVKCLCTGV